MNDLININLNKINTIEKIEDLSDKLITRMRIYYKNGLQLSIIKGYPNYPVSYGAEKGLFEIAIFDENNWYPEYFDKKDQTGDNVLGYCTKEKVFHYIEKIGLIKKNLLPKKMNQNKPDCYKCRHRRSLFYDTHSCCAYPGTKTDITDFFDPENMELIKKLNIKGHRHGLENGWFWWPINFDPIWLLSCEGFETK